MYGQQKNNSKHRKPITRNESRWPRGIIHYLINRNQIDFWQHHEELDNTFSQRMSFRNHF